MTQGDFVSYPLLCGLTHNFSSIKRFQCYKVYKTDLIISLDSSCTVHNGVILWSSKGWSSYFDNLAVETEHVHCVLVVVEAQGG